MTASMLVLCVLGWSTVVPQPWDVHGVLTWAWVALLFLFVVAESVQLNVEIRRETVSLSLSELPLVLGLFVLDPLPLLLARVAGGLVAKPQHRAPTYKTAFNAALFCVEGTLASAVFAGLGGSAVEGPQAWAAAYASTIAVSVATGGLLLLAVARLQGRRPRWDVVRWLGPLVVGALTSTSAALLALVVGGADVRALPLIGLVGALLVVGYRVYGRLLHRHETLQRLQSFTAALGAGASAAALMSEALGHARALLAADCAQVVVVGEGGTTRTLRRHGDQEGPASAEQTAGVVAAVLADGLPRRLLRGTPDADARAWLRLQGLRDAVVVPMLGADGVRGVLLVGQRLGETSSFGEDDVDLLEMVATHLEIALRSAELVERLRQEATHDGLTGLPNRALLHERLSTSVTRRSGDETFAVLLMDLDGFKDVNDTLGHDSGDEVLVQVARRLTAAAPPDATVARLGGDEFCLLVPLPARGDDLTVVVDRLHAELRAPLLVSGVELQVRASVGAALCPQHGHDSSVLLRHADIAMYSAKAAQGELRVYEPEIDRATPSRLALLNDLRTAVGDGQLACHYQPKVRVADASVTGVEALVRWQHPTLGNVPPDDFIPMAEHSGLIVPLTDLVLRSALADCARWARLGHHLDVAVNVSPRALLDPAFVEDVARALRRSGVPAARLTLEVTESSVMHDAVRATAVLEALHDMGVRLSVDDFGTGYSSLAYLQQLPVHEVKIDKSFVRDLATDAGDGAIVRAIVDLGHNLGLGVVAEGVEDARSLAVLRDLGCDTAQGFLVSRPLPSPGLLAWLARGTFTGTPVPSPRRPARANGVTASGR